MCIYVHVLYVIEGTPEQGDFHTCTYAVFKNCCSWKFLSCEVGVPLAGRSNSVSPPNVGKTFVQWESCMTNQPEDEIPALPMAAILLLN